MNYGSTGRRSRRVVKVGIAAVAAVAAGGALFASQAGAATVRTTNVKAPTVPVKAPTVSTKDVRVKAPHGICGMNVSEPGTFNIKSISFPHGWKGGWVNTHFQAQVGDVVEVMMTDMCGDGLGPEIPDSQIPKFRVSSQPAHNAWFDATHSRVF